MIATDCSSADGARLLEGNFKIFVSEMAFSAFGKAYFLLKGR